MSNFLLVRTGMLTQGAEGGQLGGLTIPLDTSPLPLNLRGSYPPLRPPG